VHSILGNARGISTIALILIILGSGLVGAILSYLWTVGYYVEIGIRVPENITTVTITNITFQVENSTYFHVTVLNPTYSKADAEITSIALVGTAIGVRAVNSTEPSLPYPLKKGDDVTFRCIMNWGELAGETVEVAIFITDGSGATDSLQTEFAKLEITDLAYNTSATVSQFNMTIRNRSAIALDVSKLLFGTDAVPQDKIRVSGLNITLPYRVPQNESRTLVCNWTLWNSETGTGALGTTRTVTVETLQGYHATLLKAFSSPVLLSLSNVTFSLTNTTQFILTSSAQSPHGVNLSQVTLTVGNQIYTIGANRTNATGYFLPKASNVTIHCEDPQLNWVTWSNQTITIRVYTTQGFLAKRVETVP
jgi:hypothetical protein